MKKDVFQINIVVRELVPDDMGEAWIEHRQLSACTNYATADAIIRAANGLLQPDDED